MRIIDHLAQIAHNYDALFVDLWGCVHNGVSAFSEAITALQTYRASGGAVVFVTNAPRPRAGVEAHLAELGVPNDCWDAIATSGDAARAALFTGVVGEKIWFIGEQRDAPFLEPLRLIANPANIQLVSLERAEGIVCTGPFDPLEDPSVYRSQFLQAKQKGLKLLCANPDIVVDYGETREWCAGALAALYTEMGGESLYFGKPHPPIYDLALRRLAEQGKSPDRSRILAIGDGLMTDIQGALGEDIDSLFVTGGLAAAETDTDATSGPDPAKVEAFVRQAMCHPTFAIGRLR